MARVILTQPEPRVHVVAARLRGCGHEVLVPGLSRIVGQGDDPAIRDVLARLGEFDCAVLVSPSAVHAVAQLVPEWPAAVLFAVIGPGSRAALDDAGFIVRPERVLVPREAPFEAASLMRLPPFAAPAGLHVLVLRGVSGSDGWIDALRAAGAQVQVCAVYRHEARAPGSAAVHELQSWLAQAGDDDCVVFTQIAAIGRLDVMLGLAGARERAVRLQALAIHPRIATALRQSGWQRVRLIGPGDCALVDALESPSGIASGDGD